ncbi:MAG TPA: c-type cytochrome [Gammaproteobacteria bacterium]
MTLRFLLAALSLLSLSHQAHSQESAPPVGDPERGKMLWLETVHIECRDCHGVNGEGGFGPDLAGRNLTRAQFIHAVRKPWGVMPAFADQHISDEELTDLKAYFDSLPDVDEPAPWRREVPAGAPRGLALATTSGCTQCHHPRFNNGRAVMGAINADLAWFKTILYAHTAAYPATRARIGEPPFERLAMGTFSPSRLPESVAEEIWGYISGLGFRARMVGRLSAPVPSADGVTYTLEVENTGVEGIGLTAEDLTVSLVVPNGATVVSASGAGYRGVRRDEEAGADVAVWEVSRLEPKAQLSYTLTLSQVATAENDLGGTIRWLKPTVATGPSDSVNIAPAVPLARAE